MQVNQAALGFFLGLGVDFRYSVLAATTSEENWSEDFQQLSMRLSTNQDGEGQVKKGEEKPKKIDALRNETSKKNAAAIDEGAIGRSAKSAKKDAKFVDCIGGNASGGETCAEACGEKCCLGVDSCSGFTGLVAKDGSCNGHRACFDSEIGVVSGRSCVEE